MLTSVVNSFFYIKCATFPACKTNRQDNTRKKKEAKTRLPFEATTSLNYEKNGSKAGKK